MATEKPSLYDNFTLRGESYKAGMLLLIKYLTEQEWKLGNKFPARLDFISEQIERLYKNYADDFKKEKMPIKGLVSGKILIKIRPHKI